MRLFGIYILTENEIDSRYEAARTAGYNKGRRDALLGQGWNEWCRIPPPAMEPLFVTSGEARSVWKRVIFPNELLLASSVKGLLWKLAEEKK